MALLHPNCQKLTPDGVNGQHNWVMEAFSPDQMKVWAWACELIPSSPMIMTMICRAIHFICLIQFYHRKCGGI